MCLPIWTRAVSSDSASSDGQTRRHCRPVGARANGDSRPSEGGQSAPPGRLPPPAPGCRSPASAHDLGDELAAAAQGPGQRGVGPALRLGPPEPVDDLVALGPVARGLGVGRQGLGVQFGGARRQGVGRTFCKYFIR